MAEENNENKLPQPKCVVFDENNNVQIAESGKTILVFVMGEEGVKIALNGYVTEQLLESLKGNMPKIMDNLIEDFKKQAQKIDAEKFEDNNQVDDKK